MTNKLFTVAGLTKHSAGSVTVEKIRFGTDLIRLIKMLNSSKKIWHTLTRQTLAPERVDMVELPSPMSKEDALKFLLTHPEFQSPADQALIQDEIDSRTPKAPRIKKEKPSIDSLKQRRKNVTELDILAAIN
jgi:hypothetical protein